MASLVRITHAMMCLLRRAACSVRASTVSLDRRFTEPPRCPTALRLTRGFHLPAVVTADAYIPICPFGARVPPSGPKPCRFVLTSLAGAAAFKILRISLHPFLSGLRRIRSVYAR